METEKAQADALARIHERNADALVRIHERLRKAHTRLRDSVPITKPPSEENAKAQADGWARRIERQKNMTNDDYLRLGMMPPPHFHCLGCMKVMKRCKACMKSEAPK